MRAATVHALALPALALLTAAPALGLTATGHSAAPAPRFAAASPALRLRGGGEPKDAGGKVRLWHAGKPAPHMPGAEQAEAPPAVDAGGCARVRAAPLTPGARVLSSQAPEAGKGKGDAKGAKVPLLVVICCVLYTRGRARETHTHSRSAKHGASSTWASLRCGDVRSDGLRRVWVLPPICCISATRTL